MFLVASVFIFVSLAVCKNNLIVKISRFTVVKLREMQSNFKACHTCHEEKFIPVLM